jgi:hypothetical protein
MDPTEQFARLYAANFHALVVVDIVMFRLRYSGKTTVNDRVRNGHRGPQSRQSSSSHLGGHLGDLFLRGINVRRQVAQAVLVGYAPCDANERTDCVIEDPPTTCVAR